MIIYHGKWQRPVIVPMPVEVAGLLQPVISLNGTWRHKRNVQDKQYKIKSEIEAEAEIPSSWEDIEVPCDTAMAYCKREADRTDDEHIFERTISIPDSFKNKQVFLRFEGANCYARVWIDGNFVASHYGGFTTWNCNITDYITPGQNSVLRVITEDRSRELNPHCRGGLIRDVWLMALPEIHITRLHGETTFDDEYKDATLKVMLGTSCRGKEEAEVELKLISPAGEEMEMDIPVVTFDGLCPEKEIEIKVESPLKWDADTLGFIPWRQG